MAANVKSLEEIDVNGVRTTAVKLYGQDSDGNSVPQEYEGGAAKVSPIPGPQTQTRARYLASVTTREKVEWPSGANITEITVFATVVPASTALGDEYAIIALDASSDAVANALLTQTESATDDAGWLPIPLNQLVRIPLTAALSQGSLSGGRVDVIGVGGLALNIWIGGN